MDKVSKNFIATKLPMFLQETIFIARKGVWLNVQVAIFFGTVNYQSYTYIKQLLNEAVS